uniref:Intraflagellar transport protein 52 homolog n=1 Tax=Branchiostoma floridae TaxID=7739 RepID=C3Y292_BRAFL|eukprot:XP_002609972.1 hypothetical protein BRAFLDRAFT_124392 [Branchiostoma floridae]
MDEKGQKTTILFDAAKREVFTPSNGFKSLNRKLRSSWKISMGLTFVYPYGATLNVAKPAVPALSTGTVCFPLNRPILALHQSKYSRGKLAVVGSVHMFSDQYVDKEENSKIQDVLFQWLTTDNIKLNAIDAEDPEVADYNMLPDTARLSERLRVCLQESEEIPRDFTQLFDAGIYKLDTSVVPKVIKCTSKASVTKFSCCMCFFQYSRGKLAVVGSVHMFSDQYVDKEENSKIQDVLFQWLTTDNIKLNAIDAEDPEVADYNMLPDTARLSERLRVCLQESEEIPRDFTQLFDAGIYKLDTSVVPKVIKAYETLNVKHEPLTLITPQFETPLPPLQPAVFPPAFRELPAPSLDLFDLDEAFSSEKVRLAQLTNKCTDDDLEYYVRECGDILGVSPKLPLDSRDAKHILEHVFTQVVEFKKLNQDHDMDVDTRAHGPMLTD